MTDAQTPTTPRWPWAGPSWAGWVQVAAPSFGRKALSPDAAASAAEEGAGAAGLHQPAAAPAVTAPAVDSELQGQALGDHLAACVGLILRGNAAGRTPAQISLDLGLPEYAVALVLQAGLQGRQPPLRVEPPAYDLSPRDVAGLGCEDCPCLPRCRAAAAKIAYETGGI